ncbi:MAG: fibronectin type III domain-containing protein [Nonlabens sp.]|uniref:fibronectin type III domain-containing protein n=1 Tax=Nonlabens sp. TaxID=1888209 RepID=UPI003EF9A9DF
MKHFYATILALFTVSLMAAQCNYSLEMVDNFMDGWGNGSQISVTINSGTPTVYTVPNPPGNINTVSIAVNDGDVVSLDYIADSVTPGDNEFTLFDSEGIIVVNSGFSPATGNYYNSAVTCPTCPTVSAITTNNVLANSADIAWTVGGSETEWEIEYGVSPYTVGSGGTVVTTMNNPETITGLSSVTTYDVFVRAKCSATDISASQGPVSFTTTESCPSPGVFTPVTQTANSVQFTWDANGNPNPTFEVEYGPTPYTQGSGGTVVQQFTAPFADVTGLASDTSYDFFIRIDCGMGDFSLWVGPYTAQTAISCPVITALQATNISFDSMDVDWAAGSTETQWELEYAPVGTITTPFAATPQGTVVNVMTTPSVSLSGLTAATKYDIYVRGLCDPALPDYSSATQIEATTLCTAFAPTSAAPYIEDFENFATTTTFIEELCWSGTAVDAYDWNVSGAGTPSTGTGPLSAFSGTNYFYTEASSGSAGTSVATLNGPQFDLSGLTNPSVQFYYHMFGNQIGDLILEVNDLSGAGWVAVNTISGAQQTAQADAFLLQIVNMAAYAGQTVQIRFRAVSGGTFEGDIAIDDVIVGELPPCPDPNLLATDAILDTSAILSWSENGLATSWEVEVQPTGVAQGTAGAAYENLTASNPETATGLMPETTYDFYVRSDCGTDGFSGWAGPFTFTTKCAPLAAPITEDFEMFTAAVDFTSGDCWEGSWNSTTGTEWNWNVDGAGSTPTANTGPDSASSGSNYFYVEGNGGVAGNEAILLAPIVDISALTAPAMQFSSHMFGAATGILHVDVNDGSGFTNDVLVLTGEQQTSGNAPWDVQVVDLLPFNTSGTVQVRFRAERTETAFTGLSDIAIDDVVFDEIPACPQPSALTAGTLTDTTAEILWNENGSATAWNIEYGPCGFTPGSGTTVAATMNPFTITGLTAFTCYEYYITADCGMGTLSAATGPATFTTECATFTAPYVDNFEAFTATLLFVEENCWAATAVGAYDWNVDNNASTPSSGTGPTGAFSGTNYFYVEASSGTAGDEALLVSPLIDIAGLTTPSIQFMYHMFGGDMGTLHVDVNDGTGWINDVDMIVGQQQTAQADDWLPRIIDLSTVTLTGTVIQTRLRAEKAAGSWEGDISIDDFRVDEIPTCPAPTMVAVDDTSITITDATFDWTENGTATTYDVEWGPVGYTQGTPPAAPLGGTASAVTKPYTVTGLQGSTQYDFYVRAICGASDTSVWVGPVTFQTLCDAISAPYFEDYETFAPSTTFVEELCWTASATSGFDWNVDGAASTPSTGTGPAGANSGVNYFYTEASGAAAGATATLVSPLIDLSPLTTPSVEFFYHMFGAQIGSLDLEINDGTGWVNVVTLGPGAIQTAQADPFIAQINDLTAYAGATVQFRFIATANGSFEGDISLDDFRVDELPACPNPNFLTATNITDSTADLAWTENGASTVWSVEVQPQGVAQGTMPAAYSNAAATNPETATGLMPDTLYDFYVTSDCGGGAFSNTIGPFTFKTECLPLTAPYLEDFETFTASLDVTEENCWKATFNSTSFTPYDWNLDNAGSTPSANTGPDAAFNGTNYFYVEANGGVAGSEAVLTSPLVDVSALTNPSVQFNYHMFGAGIGNLHVDVNDGSGYVNDVVLIQGQQQASGSAPWELSVIDLSAFTGTTVQVRFRAEKVGTNTLGDTSIDNVVFDELPACAQPSILSSANVTDTTADLSWNENGMATSWNVEYGPCGFTPGAGTTVVATTNSGFQITGLTGETCYDFYITADCGMGTLSSTAGPATFTTECSAIVAPYNEGFETFTVTTAFTDQNCWSTPQTTGYTWDVSTGGTGSTNTGPTAAASGANYFFTEASSGALGDEAELLSPLIDMSALTNPALTFSYHMWGPDFDTLHVDVNDGTGWTADVFTLVGQQQANQADAWQTTIVGLSAFNGSTIQIRFRGTRGASFGGDISLDDVIVDDFNGCLPPTNLAAANITATSVDISWVAGGSETVWEYAVLPSGSGAPSGAGTSTMNTAESVSGLASSSSFELYVRADCGMGNFSSWVGPLNFSTDCAPILAPYGGAVAGAPGNDFAAYPGVCWSEGDDTLVAAGPNGADGAWVTDNFGNDVASANGQSAKINIWNTAAINDWLVTPEFDLGTTTFEAIFDIAHTGFANSNATAFAGDQQVQLLITDDAGVTWTALQTWDSTTTISNTGQNVVVDLSAYSGIVQLAFWGTNGTTGATPDTEFFVDNFTIDTTASINSIESLGFSFYPNPVKDVLNINGVQNIETATVLNMLGQQVLTVNPTVANAQIDMSTLRTGVYLVQVTTDGRTSTIRVIKE